VAHHVDIDDVGDKTDEYLNFLRDVSVAQTGVCDKASRA